MYFDFEKIRDIHGEDIIECINDNYEDVAANLKFFVELGFKDDIDIFEAYPQVFIADEDSFKNKMNNFIEKLGFDYIDKIENDISLLEELL